MQTSQEISSHESVAQELLCLARQVLSDHATSKTSQAIVLRSKSSKVYSYFAIWEELPAVEEQICSQLTKESDPAIIHMAVMWENGQIDLPSHRLRSRLIALDTRNRDTLILLRGEGGCTFRTLSTTL